MFFVSLPTCLIGTMKSRPRFIKGSSRNVVTNFAIIFVLSLPIFGQFSQLLQKSWILEWNWPPISYIQNLLCKNICKKMSSFATPSCSSLKTICASEVVKYLHILLSCPTLYIIPFFKVKGFTFFTNFCFWTRLKVFGI